jgi:uncharacterized integral membrane protein
MSRRFLAGVAAVAMVIGGIVTAALAAAFRLMRDPPCQAAGPTLTEPGCQVPLQVTYFAYGTVVCGVLLIALVTAITLIEARSALKRTPGAT